MYEMQGPHWPGVPVSYRFLGCLRYAGPHHLFRIPAQYPVSQISHNPWGCPRGGPLFKR